MLRKPANTGLRNFASETGHTSGLRNNRVCEFRKLEPQCTPKIGNYGASVPAESNSLSDQAKQVGQAGDPNRG